MEIGKTFCGRTDGRTDGRTHLSSNLLGHRRGDDLKMNLSTVKWAQWDKTQSRELLGLFICVCALHCAQLLHTILHGTDLIIFPLTLQTITIALTMSIWGKGECVLIARWIKLHFVRQKLCCVCSNRWGRCIVQDTKAIRSRYNAVQSTIFVCCWGLVGTHWGNPSSIWVQGIHWVTLSFTKTKVWDLTKKLVLSTSQEIGWEEHLRNDLFCVDWDVKP